MFEYPFNCSLGCNSQDITSFWNNTGFVFDIAPSFNAIVVFAEHRFYGKSFPFPVDQAFHRDHVGLLSIEQALADYAVLLTALKQQWNIPDSPVVSFGGMCSRKIKFSLLNVS